jgi:stage II sporulation protein AA (anti-sigma F factor antagonist)
MIKADILPLMEMEMALNFRVCVKETGNQSIALQLHGDFDASSACELIDVLDKSAKKSSTVAIDTDRLRSIIAFGLDVFLLRMSRLNNTRADIQVTGRFSEVFKEA